jgi:hypothetical protein
MTYREDLADKLEVAFDEVASSDLSPMKATEIAMKVFQESKTIFLHGGLTVLRLRDCSFQDTYGDAEVWTLWADLQDEEEDE